MIKQKWAIGIDPGFRETGVVLSYELNHDLEPVAWATFACPKKDTPDIVRAVSLAGAVINVITAWIEEHEIEMLDIAIEVPIFNGNAQTVMLQARLLQEIQSGLLFMVADTVEQCYVTEVNPSTAKSLAGCGPKEKPVAQSPFKTEPPGITKFTRETLADAWAISLATWGVGGTQRDFTRLKTAMVKQVTCWPEEASYWDGICRHIEDSEEDNV